MPTPFVVRDQDNPSVSLGEWDEDGDITIPGTLTAALIIGAIQITGGTIVGNLTVTGTGRFIEGAATTNAVTTEVLGDTVPRLQIRADGRLSFGGGSGVADVYMQRYAATGLEVVGAAFRLNGPQLLFDAAGSVNAYGAAADVLATDDDFRLTTAGKGLQLKEGSNARMGTLTLNGATPVVVANTSVTADTRIFLTAQAPGGTPSGIYYVSARTPATSFSVTSVALDTSTVAYLLIEPSP